MFYEVYNDTPLVGSAQNVYYKRIEFHRLGIGDSSLLSTLRALVFPRLAPESTIDVTAARSGTLSFERRVRDASSREDSLCLVFLEPGMGAKKSWVETEFLRDNASFREVGNVRVFFEERFWARCFVDEKKKNSLVFIDSTDIRHFHYVQCGIPAFLPWYFDPKAGLSDLEMRLVKSLADRSPAAYKQCLTEIASSVNFRESAIMELLPNLEAAEEEQIERNLVDTLERANGNVERLKTELADEILRVRRTEDRLFGLRVRKDSLNKGEVMNLFLMDPKLVFEDFNGGDLTFGVKGTVDYFDEESLITALNNPGSYLYVPAGTYGKCTPEDIRILLTGVFIDREIKLRFCAKYKIRGSYDVFALKREDFSDVVYENYMPNPHVNIFSCLGSHEKEIMTCLENHNLIGAIQQCVASCKNINFKDTTVGEEFVNELFDASSYYGAGTPFELPDGRCVGTKDAIAFLKGEKADGKDD